MNPNGLYYMPKLPSFLAVICYQMTVIRNTILEDGVTRRDFLTLVPSAFFFCRNLGGKEQTGVVQLAQRADPPGLSRHRELHQSTDKSLNSGRAPFLSTPPAWAECSPCPIATEVSPGMVSKEC